MARKHHKRGGARRKDPAGGERLRTAALLFAAAMIGLGGSLVWAIRTTENGVNDGWAATSTFVFLLAVFAATVNVFRIVLFHRCPKCRIRGSRVPLFEPGDPVVYRCPKCNVEWDTGWTVADSSD